MTPTDVANLALQEIGMRVTINNFTQNTPASNAANLFYTPKTQMILRGAPWDFCRRTRLLTLLKASVVNGQVSSDPPAQPFAYEYEWPADCLKARFLIPYITPQPAGTPLTTGTTALANTTGTTTRIPFVVGVDTNSHGTPIKVIYTNLPNAQLVYTADLSQYPDMWDALFLTATTATLGAYFINALARDGAQMNQQIAIAKGALDSARSANGNESISNTDHIPDWMQARAVSGGGWAWVGTSPNGAYSGYDACEFPGGLFY